MIQEGNYEPFMYTNEPMCCFQCEIMIKIYLEKEKIIQLDMMRGRFEFAVGSWMCETTILIEGEGVVKNNGEKGKWDL